MSSKYCFTSALAGCFKAKRPNMSYYISLTIGNAKKHCDGKRDVAEPKAKTASPSNADSALGANPKPASSSLVQSAPPRSDGQAAVVALGKEDVERMIGAALEVKFPEKAVTQKTCKTCAEAKARVFFAASQWPLKQPECLECKPVDEKQRKKLLTGKKCSACGVMTPRDDFTLSQWQAGAAAKCKSCVSKVEIGCHKRLRECNTCNVKKAKAEFSKTQWEQPAKAGSRCKECCSQNLRTSHEEFKSRKESQVHEKTVAAPSIDSEDLVPWPSDDKQLAARYIVDTAVEKLPSLDPRSYQALHGLWGRAGWTQKKLTPDPSGIPGEEKLALLRACHEDLSHLGGREGLVGALRKEGKSWQNMDLDAAWFVRHCERCLSHTARGTVQSAPRSLPRPLVAGPLAAKVQAFV